jgi:hypothetical protein
MVAKIHQLTQDLEQMVSMAAEAAVVVVVEPPAFSTMPEAGMAVLALWSLGIRLDLCNDLYIRK